MSPVLRLESDQACDTCGKFGAYLFDGAQLCPDCCHGRSSCCADGAADPAPAKTDPVLPAVLRLNPNCCYEACPQCSSVRRLREFQARHPQDWESRLTGPERLVRLARDTL